LEVKPGMELSELSSWVVSKGLELGADEVASIASYSHSRQIRFANNEVSITNNWDSVSVSILLKKNRRILVSSTTDISMESIEKLLKGMVDAASVVREHESYAPLPEGPFSYATLRGVYDDRVAELGEEAVDYVEAAINSALDAGAERVAGTLTATRLQYSLSTSRGVSATHRKTGISLMVRALADGEAAGMGVSCGASLKDFRPEEAGGKAGELARMSLKVVQADAGKYTTVLGRPAAAVFFDIVAGMASAFYVDSGLSCFTDRLGEQVASEVVYVYDDPLVEDGLGSTPFDDEGLPTKRNTIIEGGVLRSYLHNSITAKRHGKKSTANAGWIAPHAWNIIVESGNYGDEELISEVRNGLFVNNMTYVRFQDYRAGDFSTIIRDGVFKIENGEIVGAVRRLRLSDNVLHMLKHVRALSRYSQQISHWWMEWGTPSVWTPQLLIEDVNYTLPAR